MNRFEEICGLMWLAGVPCAEAMANAPNLRAAALMREAYRRRDQNAFAAIHGAALLVKLLEKDA